MKLIIQIPCFNEATTLPLVMQTMPKKIPGISCIEFQIIDDCSTDKTVEVAKSLGVHHIVSIPGVNRRWLGRAFKMGIDHALRQGADIVVNTDGDNQYPSARIADLVKPIVDGRVHVVIGDRSPSANTEFSLIKRFLQFFGSSVIQYLTNTPVKDAVSGFRAYSREALLNIHIVTNYTYTVDTLIQANKKGFDIEWLNINTNRKTRESRLITNIWDKVKKSGATILRMTTVYEPFKTFLFLATFFLIPGSLLLARFLYFYFSGDGDGHVQSVIVGGVCCVIGVQMLALGIIGDLLAINRKLQEDALTRIRKLELDGYQDSEVPLGKQANS